MISREIFYFERPGPVNTDQTLTLGIRRAQELGLIYLIVPSITGYSALLAAEKVHELATNSRLQVICVTFRAGGTWNVEKPPPGKHWQEIPELRQRWEEWQRKGLKRVVFDEEIKARLAEYRIPVVQATDLAADIESSMASDLGVNSPKTIMKETLFLICPGLKVAVFTTMTAADSGAIPVEQEVVSFGGTEQGLDTALVVKPSYSDRVFHPRYGFEIREIICKPRSMIGASGFYYDRAWGAQS